MHVKGHSSSGAFGLIFASMVVNCIIFVLVAVHGMMLIAMDVGMNIRAAERSDSSPCSRGQDRCKHQNERQNPTGGTSEHPAVATV